MARRTAVKGGEVTISGDWWMQMQQALLDAVDGCNDITGQIAAHHHHGKCMAEELLDSIEGDVRAIRKLIEKAITPF